MSTITLSDIVNNQGYSSAEINMIATIAFHLKIIPELVHVNYRISAVIHFIFILIIQGRFCKLTFSTFLDKIQL